MLVGANLPRFLPKSFKGVQPKTIQVTSVVPRARHGDFEPEQEVHRVCTASMIKQLRRIQSLPRKLEKGMGNESLILEWRRIVHFVFQGLSFVSWIQHQLWLRCVGPPGPCRCHLGFSMLNSFGGMNSTKPW